MEKKMSVMGIGHKAGAIVGLCLIITIVIDRLFTNVFQITENSYNTLFKVGIIMMIVGFSVNLIAAFQMLKAYKSGRLATKGLYAIFLNPMYVMQLMVTVPGLALLFNSWLVLSTVIVAIIAVKVFVKEEEKYLEERFGEDYRKYKEKVLIKI